MLRYCFVSIEGFIQKSKGNNCLHQRDYHRELEIIIRIDQIRREREDTRRILIKVKLILFQNTPEESGDTYY